MKDFVSSRRLSVFAAVASVGGFGAPGCALGEGEIDSLDREGRFRKGGIIIPDTAKEKPQEGEVLAVAVVVPRTH